LFYGSAKFFARKKAPLFNYYSKTKGFYFRIIFKHLKNFAYSFADR